MDRMTEGDIGEALHESGAEPELDSSVPARTRKIEDYCKAHDDALQLYGHAQESWETYRQAIEKANKAAKFVAPNQSNFFISPLEFGREMDEAKTDDQRREVYRARVARAGWRELLENTKAATLLDAQAKEEFRASLDNPAPFTAETCESTLAALYGEAESMQNRGLVNIFTKLNWRDYVSNDCFTIGPRIIVEYALEKVISSFSWKNYRTRDLLIDLERIIDLLEGREAKPPQASIVRCMEAGKQDLDDPNPRYRGLDEQEYEDDVFLIRWFLKGTMHIRIKSPDIRAKLNRMIASHFGASLGDDSGRPNAHDPHFTGKKRERNTGISKIDQNAFYTPPKLAEKLARLLQMDQHPGPVVLDPSCGHGALMRAALDAGCGYIHGVENHVASANACKDDMAKRFKAAGKKLDYCRTEYLKVYKADFELWRPDNMIDYTHIFMNPPFDHQLRHVVKAFGHMRKGTVDHDGTRRQGCLVSVMAASILTNNNHDHKEFRAWLKAKGATIWRLKPGSFRASGTNVETIAIRIPAEMEQSR
jgi:16S rRNA G966 N2-methylase RsmD